MSDLEVVDWLGKGAVGKVYLVRQVRYDLTRFKFDLIRFKFDLIRQISTAHKPYRLILTTDILFTVTEHKGGSYKLHHRIELR